MKKVFCSIAISFAAISNLAGASQFACAQDPSNGVAGTVTQTASQGMEIPGFEWSLPCEAKLTKVVPGATAGNTTAMLQGSVTAFDVDQEFGNLIDTMLDGALSQNEKLGHLDKAVAHFRKPSVDKIEKTKDAANWIIPYRGNGQSSLAADVILDEKIKVKDRASAEYARQRYVDSVHPNVVARTLQLALAVGMQDPSERGPAVDSAMGSLTKLVGKERADLALQRMQSWSQDVKVPSTLYKSSNQWDVDFFQTKLKSVTKVAMDGDPIMVEVVKRLQKYNHKSLLSRATKKVTDSAFAIGTWAAPGFIIPAAIEVVNAASLAATGGTEEAKLVKELYYDKRVESRYRAINEEAQMALTQYQNALNVKNPVLLVCSESVLTQLVGSEHIQEVLGGKTLLTHRIPRARAIETAQSASQSVQ